MNTPLYPSRLPSKTDNFAYETKLHDSGCRFVAGCDEVGRGPLAGPVVAAAVILPPTSNPTVYQDSKKLSHKKRLELYQRLKEEKAVIGIGIVDEKMIDRINILQASLLAMKLSVENITMISVDYILVDGKFTIPLQLPQQALIKGETQSASIAAASIAAKVTRDLMMEEWHMQYPEYNFAKNKGYPTREHKEAVKKYGPCPIHRRTFKGVAEHVS